MCDHVGYESRLELSRLLFADFDPGCGGSWHSPSCSGPPWMRGNANMLRTICCSPTTARSWLMSSRDAGSRVRRWRPRSAGRGRRRWELCQDHEVPAIPLFGAQHIAVMHQSSTRCRGHVVTGSGGRGRRCGRLAGVYAPLVQMRLAGRDYAARLANGGACPDRSPTPIK